MSTNAALVDSLEYYMDDLVDCFEDFVKKSLVVISVALGTIILMVMYVLKVLAERAVVTGARNTSAVGANTEDPRRCQSDTTVESDTSTSEPNQYGKSKEISSNYIISGDNTTSPAPVASRPSFDEKVLREVGLSSCSKPCNTSKRTLARNYSGSKIALPSLATSCISKHHLSTPRPCSKYIAIRTSCCSMCCVDDDRR